MRFHLTRTLLCCMPLLFAACGAPGDAMTPDPGRPDPEAPAPGPMMPMMPGPTGMKGTNVVSVKDAAGMPAAGVAVVVNDAAGAVTQELKTGADGTVAVAVPAGGSVSIFQALGSRHYIDSVIEPPQGASLPFVLQAGPAMAKAPTTYTLALSDLPAKTIHVRYTFACGATALGGTVRLNGATSITVDTRRCPDLSAFSVLLNALDMEGRPIAWGALFDQPVRPGQTVAATVSLKNTDFATASFQITGIPTGLYPLIFTLRPRMKRWPNLPLGLNRTSLSSEMKSTQRGQVSVPAGLVEDGAEATLTLRREAGQAELVVSRLEQLRTLPGSAVLAADKVPTISLMPVDASDAAHPRLSWRLMGAAFGDGGRLAASFAGETTTVEYLATFPTGARPTAVRLPDIPASLRSFVPAARSRIAWYAVEHRDYDQAKSYGDYLARRGGAAGDSYTYTESHLLVADQ